MVTALGTSFVAIVAAARVQALMALATAATIRSFRRIGSTSISTGVFVGGVLSTRSAWIMGFIPLVVRVRAGAEAATSPRLAFLVHEIHEQSNNTYAKISGQTIYWRVVGSSARVA
jgi:hypothetical protein